MIKNIVFGVVLVCGQTLFAASQFPNLQQVLSDIEVAIELIDQGKGADAEKVLATFVLPQTREWGNNFSEKGSGFIKVLIGQEPEIYKMTPAEIEELWHHGQYFAQHPELGLDFGDFESSHFQKWNNIYDAILHPVTAIVDIRVGALDAAKNELSEVLAHISSLEE